jgi:hypothetical protein
VRNSIIVMLNKEFYRWLKGLTQLEVFQESIALSDRAIDEQYDMELALRFLVFRAMPESQLTGLGDLGDFLTDRASELARDKSFDTQGEGTAFASTFTLLRDQLGGDAFRRYDAEREKFVGGFSVSAFEAIALGVGYNYKVLQQNAGVIPERAKSLWSDSTFTLNSGSGIRASSPRRGSGGGSYLA